MAPTAPTSRPSPRTRPATTAGRRRLRLPRRGRHRPAHPRHGIPTRLPGPRPISTGLHHGAGTPSLPVLTAQLRERPRLRNVNGRNQRGNVRHRALQAIAADRSKIASADRPWTERQVLRSWSPLMPPIDRYVLSRRSVGLAPVVPRTMASFGSVSWVGVRATSTVVSPVMAV